jgi:hypothetical protein
LGRHLGDPYGGFRRFDLAEERAGITELMMSPVLKEPRGLRCNLPLIGIGQGAPCFDIATDFIDDRSGIVLLLLCRKATPSSNTNPVWAAALRFFGFGIGVTNLAPRRDSTIKLRALSFASIGRAPNG